MDAGIKDNFGQETSMRFIDNFEQWINENTGGVVILQIRDRMNDYWEKPLETGSISDIVVKPATMLQSNWHNFQDYTQADQYSYLMDSANYKLHRLTFMYGLERPFGFNCELKIISLKNCILFIGESLQGQFIKNHFLILNGLSKYVINGDNAFKFVVVKSKQVACFMGAKKLHTHFRSILHFNHR